MNKEEKKPLGISGEHDGIAYQNKDIASKYFAEEYKNTLFKVFGLDLPDIVSVEPTELPTVEVNDMAMDNLFLLADGSYAVIDYESDYSEEKKVKYLGYVARVLKRVYNQTKEIPRIRIIIVYTADVREGSTKSILDMGDERLMLTEAFLSNLIAGEIFEECESKIKNGMELTAEDKLRLMICPLSRKGVPDKIAAIRQAIDIICLIEDVREMKKLLAGLWAFNDKMISRKDVEEIRRLLNMTKIEQIIYEEQQEAVTKAVKKTETKVRAEEKAERDRLESEIIRLQQENEELKKKYALV